MAGPYYKWVDDYTQGNKELESDASINAIFDEMQGYLVESAILAGYKNLEQIATELEQFINQEISGIFTELVTMGAIDVNVAPSFVTDYGYFWPNLSQKYLTLKESKKYGLSGGQHFFFLNSDLLDELMTTNPLGYLGGSTVSVAIQTEGYRLNSVGQLIDTNTGRYVKYDEIEYTIGYSFLWRAFQYIEDGIPPELTLPRTISKKLLGRRRAGIIEERKGVNPQTRKWEKMTDVIETPTELQDGAVRPLLMPLLFWFEKQLQMKVEDKLGIM